MTPFPGIKFPIFEKAPPSILLAAVGLLTYTSLRAYLLGMTHDESGTFLYFLEHPIFQAFFRPGAWPDANLHWLYVFFLKTSVALFGTSELAIRLPSLLAHAAYLFFSYKLLRCWTSSRTLLFLGFLLLNLNPYLLEFFALARGYGMALALMMASLFYLSKWVQTKKNAFAAGSFATAAFAVLANLTWLNFYALLLAIFAGLWLLDFFLDGKKLGKINLTSAGIAGAFSLVLFLFIHTPVTWLREKNMLYYGASSLLDMFNSLTISSLYNATPFELYNVEIVGGSFLLLFLVALFVSLRKFFQAKTRPLNRFALVACLFPVLLCLGTVVQHVWLGTPYLFNRTALMFLPMLGLPIFFLFVQINWKSGWRRLLPFALILPLLVHAYFAFNLALSREWWFDGHTKDVLLYLEEKTPTGEKVKLGVHWSFQPTCHFYVKNLPLHFTDTPPFHQDIRQKAPFDYDYYYIPPSEQHLLEENYILEKEFGYVGRLMRRKK